MEIPLDDVARNLASPPVVDPGRAGVGMASEILNVFERDILFQEIGHGCHSKRVRREVTRQARCFQMPFHHPADVDTGHCVLRQRLRLAVRGAKEGPSVIFAAWI
jgi:hypothetical protein